MVSWQNRKLAMVSGQLAKEKEVGSGHWSVGKNANSL